jgi:hypothetical protein
LKNAFSILRVEIAKQLSHKSKCYITIITTTGTFTAVRTPTLEMNEKFVSYLEGATLPLKY